MQRQKSILSFFQKPSTASQGSIADGMIDGRKANKYPASQQNKTDAVSHCTTVHIENDSLLEIRGTDTPQVKVPRQIFPASFRENESPGGSSLFSSIMHKFAKDDGKKNDSHRKQEHESSSEVISISGKFSAAKGLAKGKLAAQPLQKKLASTFNEVADQSLLDIERDDVLGPETPGMQPCFPRSKRIQESCPTFGDRMDPIVPGSSKKTKLLHGSLIGNKSTCEETETVSKFKWLDPSWSKDAVGRKPCDPHFDKKTVYIPPDDLKKMSASQRQYWSIKCQYMDVLLFFKVGKFYELYELDAEIGHKELDWKMTVSGVGKCRQVGISESGIDDAVQRLVARGYKVGRIEQLETSDQAKSRGTSSVIQRKLVSVITPSTITDGNIGPDAIHLLAIKEEKSGLDNGPIVFGFAFVDCASLRFRVGSISDDASYAALGALLVQVSPKEVIYESTGLSREAQKALRKYSSTGSTSVQLTHVPPFTGFADPSEVTSLIETKGYFKGSPDSWKISLDSLRHHDMASSALGGLIGHLSRLMLEDVLRNGVILPYQLYSGCLRMDGQTLVNLEIFSNSADGGPSGTLYKYLDSCVTPFGKQLLRSWICHPLKDVVGINNRLNVVEGLIAHAEIMQLVYPYLRKLPDLERLLGRVRASVQSSASLMLPMVGKKILKNRVKAFGSLVKGLRIGMDMLILLQNKDCIITSLYKVFKLPTLSGSNGLDEFLNQFEAAIDSDFPSYQNHETTDTDAETLSILIELFTERSTGWSEVIHAISCIDVLRSFAVSASLSSGAMARPVIFPESETTSNQETRGPMLKIKGLWHPFALGGDGAAPIPNDICLGEDSDSYHPRSLLLTGPNMGGKSTLLRATCLAVILAQLGCYVPCEMCVLSVVDIIFTRLGATDRIMTGESTFLVECSETASVLQNATQHSLVLLDELGRGTSTFDGYAIAYAVFRHLVEKVNCRLLFATHYHPLTKEFASHPHVTLQHMACAFKLKNETCPNGDKDLVFLYRLTDGACPESYGLQVATMAGIDKEIVEAASQASQVMKKSVGKSFKSSERRSEFSSLHEDWLKTLLNLSRIDVDSLDDEDDAYDTLFCLLHEVKSSYARGK